ncbi:bifunctional diguanylate cyclase/phosphodiesterase [Pararhodospirillum oryzae]|uniref:Sensor protein FixL n=1 Tax=Pararhodospirillum oryzae TaxID=478448 RepID=A0A512H5I0_9PROT|nr:bifunctional diguanylate cyclase/phosphodiesterase [Pararhodospirillum oryzae]GEO80729.1 hypothetical protein ROR02_08600 [Pararhodospirillum oryzae]
MLKVLLIENQTAPGDAVSSFQADADGWGIVLTTVDTVAAGVAALRQGNHQVAVIDLDCSGHHDPASLRLVMAAATATRTAVIALAGEGQEDHVEALIDLGAYECLPRASVTHDTLHRVVRRAALRAALETLQENGERTRRQLTGLEHDVRTALTTIVGYAHLIEHEDNAGRRIGYARLIDQAAASLEEPLRGLSALDLPGLETDLDGAVVIDMAPDLACVVRDGRVVHVNPAGASLLGVSPTALIGRPVDLLVPPDTLGDLVALLGGPVRARRPLPGRLMRADGTDIEVLMSVSPYGGSDQAGSGSVLFVARDVSERARAHREADRQAAFLRAVTDTMVDALVVTDEAGRIERFNKAAERLFGVGAEEIIGRSITLLMPAREARAHDQHMRTYLKTGQSRVIGIGRELRARRLDGSEFPIELALSVVAQEGRRRFVGVIRDITERKEHEEQLVTLATRDPLTGLPNRVLLREHLEKARSRALTPDGPLGFAVLFVDIDHFKKINDTMGHVMGDQVIRAMADRLEKHLRPLDDDMLAHLGGDEFTVFLGEGADSEAVRQRAEALMTDLVRPYDIGGREVFTSVSVGAARFPDDGDDVSTLLRNVDTALHHAKRQKCSSVMFYTPKLSADAVRRLHIETGLRRALERDEFEVHFQPKVDLVSGEVLGAEALLRWDGRDIGKVSPVEFVPVAEETGLVQPIGEWVLRQACAQAATWQQGGLPALRMGVNLSARQFNDPDLAEKVRAILDETALDPAMLDLELTESMLVEDGDQAVRVLKRLKSLGITLSIDDFGTGYSSFGYLKRFPIDYIKIDRSFVVDLPNNADDMAITRAIASMASALRLRLVAEGVETNEQVTFLRTLGCHQGQGFLYSRPVPAAAFEALLKRLNPEGNGVHPAFRDPVPVEV